MTDVKGRIAFVTGAASGIGLGLTQALLEAGARVVMADVDAAKLAEAHGALGAPDRLFPLTLDVRDRAAFAQAADRVEREFGPVTLLFNNAGVGGGYAPEYTTYDHWDHTLGINVGGVVNGIQTFLQRMIAGGDRCHIVNTASGAGLAVLGKAAGGILYITSKYAVVGLSEALSILMQEKNIGVSVFCPGVVSTNIVRAHAQLPPPGRELTSAEQEQLDQKEQALLEVVENGMPILEAGRIVLRAVAENQLFIHTSRVMETAFRQRAEAVLATMPAIEATGAPDGFETRYLDALSASTA